MTFLTLTMEDQQPFCNMEEDIKQLLEFFQAPAVCRKCKEVRLMKNDLRVCCDYHQLTLSAEKIEIIRNQKKVVLVSKGKIIYYYTNYDTIDKDLL
jgi:hypothetical protein